MKVDVIGGSISGLNSAISLKKADNSIKVTLHEKHKEIGYNPEGRRCGEAHSIEEPWKQWMPKGKSIFNEISYGEASVGKKIYKYTRAPNTAFILNRQEFIRQLYREAKKLGTEIKTSDKIKSIKNFDSDYIIDASGCPSIVKKELGIKHGFVGITYQQTLEKCNVFNSKELKVKFIGEFGYIWIFPRNPEKKEVNLGIGLIGKNNHDIKKMLEDFKINNNITGKINYVLGGFIPLGLQKPLIYKNILFVGDAGIGAYPFNGQGIYRALTSGDIAGKSIARGKPKEYKHIIMKRFKKWDFAGKWFIRTNRIATRINPDLVLYNLNTFFKFNDKIMH